MEEEKKEVLKITDMDSSEDEVEEVQEYETDSSSDGEGSEKCPICLLKLTNDHEIGKPAVCDHSFCFPCIEEWSKVMRTCPIDRKEFSEIKVFDNLEKNNLLRTVAVGKVKISLDEYTAGETEYTSCEICRSIEREDVMLLCDGCDKGFHMDCLDPPMFHIPIDNWYCQECEAASSESSDEDEDESVDEEADAAEVNDLQEEIQNELGQLPSTRLRARAQQPQILRTLQSERIRNAILARRTQRVVRDINLPSTSASTSLASTSRNTLIAIRPKRKSPKKRKTRRKARSQVVEYDIKNGVKFPIKVKKRAVRKTKRKKKRKVRKGRRFTKKSTPFKDSATSFRGANSNVYDLQRGRQLAGLTNFNIFQPTNQLDYVPDEDDVDENIIQPQLASGEDVLTQGIINYINPHRRQAIIKKRVIDNFVTTSSSSDLIDSILNEKNFFLNSKSNGLNENKKVKKATDGNLTGKSNDNKIEHQERQATDNVPSRERDQQILTEGNTNQASQNQPNRNEDEQQQPQQQSSSSTCNKKSPQKKKKLSFDMFEEESQENLHGGCPNFSIYDSVADDPIPSTSADDVNSPLEEVSENFDLVQMSDEGEHQINADDIEPAVIVKSQPASPDLDNDGGDQISQERSYTPPLVPTSQSQDVKEQEHSKKSKKNKDKDKRSKRQEMERYNVREKVREKSPLRTKDQFGRNRTRSRSRSRGGKKRNRSRSKSVERKQRHRHKSSSVTKKRDSSEDRKRKLKTKRKRSKSRSPSGPRFNYNRRDEKGEPSRRKRHERSPPASEKLPKKKKEKTSTQTKEVYSSGQNILVSVNFSNQEDKRSTKSMSRDNNEPIVDITAKKKINVSSKPVAIIDLARSPFKELTPDYKKESNVIELSDSDGGGEKHFHLLKSPDSTKLYDPFDILNSPPNQNVSSSQQNAKQTSTIKLVEYRENSKANVQIPVIQKHLNNEENLVSSSSSINAFEKNFPARPSKIEASLQHEIIQTLNMEIESPYSPGNDDTYQDSSSPFFKTKSNASDKPPNILDELFGTSSPADKTKKSSTKPADPTNKFINKLKRQERVIEEVKTAIKPHYSKRAINKEQYKEIMKKAVPKICHNKSGEINPTKIKHLIDSYVKFYTHKKKRIDEI